MSRPVTFTLDLEDLRTSATQELRVEVVTDRLLDRLAALGVTGTVFAVGEVVRDHPALLRRVVEAGHEVALHGWRHVPLDLVDRQAFKRETHDARNLIEDVTGQSVVGYRAPQFSLVPETLWAVDILGDLGFQYSSSVMPASSPLYGWPEAPATPFQWPNGIVELPCPVVVILGRPIPFLGGTYLRILPDAVRRHGERSSPPQSVLWSYCHPWEFDTDEKFYVFEHGGVIASLVGWTGRRRMMGRVERVFADGAAPRMAEVAGRAGDLPVFRPPAQSPTRGRLQGVLRRRSSTT